MNNNDLLEDKLKIFTFQNLMLETELIRIEKSGIDIGHLKTIEKKEVVDTELFEIDIRKEAIEMANFYVLYYCLENTIRRVISGKLEEEYGPNWWETKVTENVKTDVKKRQKQESDTPMSIRGEDPLSYTTFGELIQIFEHNWDDFSDIIRSKSAMRQTLSQLNRLRGVIAHSCYLNKDEILRFELLIRDWLRIQT